MSACTAMGWNDAYEGRWDSIRIVNILYESHSSYPEIDAYRNLTRQGAEERSHYDWQCLLFDNKLNGSDTAVVTLLDSVWHLGVTVLIALIVRSY